MGRLAFIDIDFIAEGAPSDSSASSASEEGMYHLIARLFDEQKLISSKLASCYVSYLKSDSRLVGGAGDVYGST